MTCRTILATAALAASLAANAAAPTPSSRSSAGGATVLWPLGNGKDPYQIGTAYGQFQQIGSLTADYHDGIDILAEPGQVVYALEKGTVMYVDGSPANPESYGVAIESADRPGTGFYYVHLLPDDGAHWVGQEIPLDHPLGTTVVWTDTTNYDHLHLSLVEMRPDSEELDPAAVPLLYTGSPLARLDRSADQVEPDVLEILFLKNGSASEFEPDPESRELHVDGAVDVVARVQDGFREPASGETPRLLIPYAVRLEILRATSGEICYRNEIVFDGQLGRLYKDAAQTVYKVFGSTHKSAGDYDERAFYVIATNDPPYEDDAWDTALSGAGEYVVRVTAIDLAGHETSKDARVTVP